MNGGLMQVMESANCRIVAKLTKFDGVVPTGSAEVELMNEGNEQLFLEQSRWSIACKWSPVENKRDVLDCEVTFQLIEGSLSEANVSVDIMLDQWSKDHYVMMPAAAYNGNRFKATKEKYPPMLTLEEETGPDIPTIITDVPRLSLENGPSKLEVRTGDMATPAVGFCSRADHKGLFMLAAQGTRLGESGISLEENEDRTKAVISLSAPAVRRFHYRMCNSKESSDDRGADFRNGDEVTLSFRLHVFDCPDIPSLYGYFAGIRKDLTGKVRLRHEIPFSAAWEILEEKYNRDNWQQQHGFYRSSTSPDPTFGQWQTGWVGGGINTLPKLAIGSELSQERARQTLDFMFNTVQAASGFFYGIFSHGQLLGDAFRAHEDTGKLLIRKHADAVYFLVKQFMLLDKRNEEISDVWKDGLIKACDALVRLWKNHKQFGQFVDADKETIIIGGSACAGIAPAGLALAGQYLGRPDYLAIAEQSADDYYERFVSQGVTTGAPGEISQCPDSESAFALLESYVALHETTGERKWLKMAEDTAKLCATWCVSYDYEYPLDSEFRKLDLRSAGAVWASVQNKHAAPGICTLSGVSLFKLYRATGNPSYLELIQEIAHHLPQYLSREDRPLEISWGGLPTGRFSPPGWMGERVNTSDWEGKENIGAIAGGSCWCEVSAMLTYLEVPGVYIQPDTGFVCAIDHIDAEVLERNETELRVMLNNPTKFPAKVRVFAERSGDMRTVMGEHAMIDCTVVTIAPLSHYTVSFDRR
ncbi:glycoside hydrolase family 47 protein [Paenibacillus sp. LHD-117]|uniref:glycoside hydrolase family 47 protein n=1 Tax=Paenibacillus sp. LHD-117 TaxID=3071412 RepID=UPI0027DEC3BD|nr:glycoside hydrolase family 47 protein [Paenibacillus sp. LHD-117]MDQ6419991.1 glycoside hydrolase family 47 protein [Paenibacillus sp. LHD-117]